MPVLFTLICRSYILLYAVLHTLICPSYILLYADPIYYYMPILYSLICRSYILVYAGPTYSYKLVLYILVRRSILVMVLNTTFNNISVISWQSVLLVETTATINLQNKIKLLFSHNSFQTYAECLPIVCH